MLPSTSATLIHCRPGLKLCLTGGVPWFDLLLLGC